MKFCFKIVEFLLFWSLILFLYHFYVFVLVNFNMKKEVLSRCVMQKKYKVGEINLPQNLKQKLNNIGISSGSEIVVVAKNYGNTSILVKVNSISFAVDIALASKVEVYE